MAHSNMASVSGRGMKTPGTDVQHNRAERRRAGEMLQRHSPRARSDDVVVSHQELVVDRLDQGQPAALGADDVSGQLLGIATRRIDSGFGEQRRSRVDGAPQDRHACCNRDLFVGRAQCVEQRIQVAVENLVEIVCLETDSVISDPVLREVIGANSFAAVHGADLAGPIRRRVGLCLLLGECLQTGGQHLHCPDLVLQL